MEKLPTSLGGNLFWWVREKNTERVSQKRKCLEHVCSKNLDLDSLYKPGT